MCQWARERERESVKVNFEFNIQLNFILLLVVKCKIYLIECRQNFSMFHIPHSTFYFQNLRRKYEALHLHTYKHSLNLREREREWEDFVNKQVLHYA